LTFDLDSSVSVFETNIRVLGAPRRVVGLTLSTAADACPAQAACCPRTCWPATPPPATRHVPLRAKRPLRLIPLTHRAFSLAQVEGYDGGLLRLALDLGTRLLPAFATPTGIPFGAINLRRGVAANESSISSTAGGGTLALEFGLLSALSGDVRFEAAARRAVRGLWARRSALGLLGAHIDIRSGQWTHRDAGIGTSIDSFYEYLFKASRLLSDAEYGHMFEQAYRSVEKHLYRDPWYVEVNMDSAVVVWPLFNSLQAFWPGLQALAGRAAAAQRTHAAFMSVWRRVGFTPEGYNLAAQAVQPGQASYPLRPELAESTYHLYAATGDAAYLAAGRDMVVSLRRTRAACGYAMVADVATGALADTMESFFLAETLKYLYLLFDAGAAGPDASPGGSGLPRGRNFVDRGATAYVFNTEGHPLPVRDQWRAPREGPPADGNTGGVADEPVLAVESSKSASVTATAPAVVTALGEPQQHAVDDAAPMRRGRRHAAPTPAVPLLASCPADAAAAAVDAPSPAAAPPIADVASADATDAADGDGDDVDVPAGVSATVADAYVRFGPGSPAVRALAAEVAAAQQGIVAAQLLAHVAASGVPVSSMQIRVQAEADGSQRVLLFVNGQQNSPIWASAPGVGPGGLLSLPGAESAAQTCGAAAVGGAEPVADAAVDDDEYEDPGEDPAAPGGDAGVAQDAGAA
jgi:hypothetical protein